jgi:transcriptional regulator with XRE-family HTH domain
MSEFKDMLKYLRKRDGYSQAELSEKLSISKSTISMYEIGQRKPDFETLEKIADFFNVDMNFLLGKSGSENDHGFYLNPETASIAQEIHDNKEMRALFSAARDASPEDLKTTYDVLLALKRKERGNDD